MPSQAEIQAKIIAQLKADQEAAEKKRLRQQCKFMIDALLDLDAGVVVYQKLDCPWVRELLGEDPNTQLPANYNYPQQIKTRLSDLITQYLESHKNYKTSTKSIVKDYLDLLEVVQKNNGNYRQGWYSAEAEVKDRREPGLNVIKKGQAAITAKAMLEKSPDKDTLIPDIKTKETNLVINALTNIALNTDQATNDYAKDRPNDPTLNAIKTAIIAVKKEKPLAVNAPKPKDRNGRPVLEISTQTEKGGKYEISFALKRALLDPEHQAELDNFAEGSELEELKTLSNELKDLLMKSGLVVQVTGNRSQQYLNFKILKGWPGHGDGSKVEPDNTSESLIEALAEAKHIPDNIDQAKPEAWVDYQDAMLTAMNRMAEGLGYGVEPYVTHREREEANDYIKNNIQPFFEINNDSQLNSYDGDLDLYKKILQKNVLRDLNRTEDENKLVKMDLEERSNDLFTPRNSTEAIPGEIFLKIEKINGFIRDLEDPKLNYRDHYCPKDKTQNDANKEYDNFVDALKKYKEKYQKRKDSMQDQIKSLPVERMVLEAEESLKGFDTYLSSWESEYFSKNVEDKTVFESIKQMVEEFAGDQNDVIDPIIENLIKNKENYKPYKQDAKRINKAIDKLIETRSKLKNFKTRCDKRIKIIDEAKRIEKLREGFERLKTTEPKELNYLKFVKYYHSQASKSLGPEEMGNNFARDGLVEDIEAEFKRAKEALVKTQLTLIENKALKLSERFTFIEECGKICSVFLPPENGRYNDAKSYKDIIQDNIALRGNLQFKINKAIFNILELCSNEAFKKYLISEVIIDSTAEFTANNKIQHLLSSLNEAQIDILGQDLVKSTPNPPQVEILSTLFPGSVFAKYIEFHRVVEARVNQIGSHEGVNDVNDFYSVEKYFSDNLKYLTGGPAEKNLSKTQIHRDQNDHPGKVHAESGVFHLIKVANYLGSHADKDKETLIDAHVKVLTNANLLMQKLATLPISTPDSFERETYRNALLAVEAEINQVESLCVEGEIFAQEAYNHYCTEHPELNRLRISWMDRKRGKSDLNPKDQIMLAMKNETENPVAQATYRLMQMQYVLKNKIAQARKDLLAETARINTTAAETIKAIGITFPAIEIDGKSYSMTDLVAKLSLEWSPVQFHDLCKALSNRTDSAHLEDNPDDYSDDKRITRFVMRQILAGYLADSMLKEINFGSSEELMQPLMDLLLKFDGNSLTGISNHENNTEALYHVLLNLVRDEFKQGQINEVDENAKTFSDTVSLHLDINENNPVKNLIQQLYRLHQGNTRIAEKKDILAANIRASSPSGIPQGPLTSKLYDDANVEPQLVAQKLLDEPVVEDNLLGSPATKIQAHLVVKKPEEMSAGDYYEVLCRVLNDKNPKISNVVLYRQYIDSIMTGQGPEDLNKRLDLLNLEKPNTAENFDAYAGLVGDANPAHRPIHLKFIERADDIRRQKDEFRELAEQMVTLIDPNYLITPVGEYHAPRKFYDEIHNYLKAYAKSTEGTPRVLFESISTAFKAQEAYLRAKPGVVLTKIKSAAEALKKLGTALDGIDGVYGNIPSFQDADNNDRELSRWINERSIKIAGSASLYQLNEMVANFDPDKKMLSKIMEFIENDQIVGHGRLGDFNVEIQSQYEQYLSSSNDIYNQARTLLSVAKFLDNYSKPNELSVSLRQRAVVLISKTPMIENINHFMYFFSFRKLDDSGKPIPLAERELTYEDYLKAHEWLQADEKNTEEETEYEVKGRERLYSDLKLAYDAYINLTKAYVKDENSVDTVKAAFKAADALLPVINNAYLSEKNVDTNQGKPAKPLDGFRFTHSKIIASINPAVLLFEALYPKNAMGLRTNLPEGVTLDLFTAELKGLKFDDKHPIYNFYKEYNNLLPAGKVGKLNNVILTLLDSQNTNKVITALIKERDSVAEHTKARKILELWVYPDHDTASLDVKNKHFLLCQVILEIKTGPYGPTIEALILRANNALKSASAQGKSYAERPFLLATAANSLLILKEKIGVLHGDDLDQIKTGISDKADETLNSIDFEYLLIDFLYPKAKLTGSRNLPQNITEEECLNALKPANIGDKEKFITEYFAYQSAGADELLLKRDILFSMAEAIGPGMARVELNHRADVLYRQSNAHRREIELFIRLILPAYTNASTSIPHILYKNVEEYFLTMSNSNAKSYVQFIKLIPLAYEAVKGIEKNVSDVTKKNAIKELMPLITLTGSLQDENGEIVFDVPLDQKNKQAVVEKLKPSTYFQNLIQTIQNRNKVYTQDQLALMLARVMNLKTVSRLSRIGTSRADSLSINDLKTFIGDNPAMDLVSALEQANKSHAAREGSWLNTMRATTDQSNSFDGLLKDNILSLAELLFQVNPKNDKSNVSMKNSKGEVVIVRVADICAEIQRQIRMLLDRVSSPSLREDLRLLIEARKSHPDIRNKVYLTLKIMSAFDVQPMSTKASILYHKFDRLPSILNLGNSKLNPQIIKNQAMTAIQEILVSLSESELESINAYIKLDSDTSPDDAYAKLDALIDEIVKQQNQQVDQTKASSAAGPGIVQQNNLISLAKLAGDIIQRAERNVGRFKPICEEIIKAVRILKGSDAALSAPLLQKEIELQIAQLPDMQSKLSTENFDELEEAYKKFSQSLSNPQNIVSSPPVVNPNLELKSDPTKKVVSNVPGVVVGQDSEPSSPEPTSASSVASSSSTASTSSESSSAATADSSPQSPPTSSSSKSSSSGETIDTSDKVVSNFVKALFKGKDNEQYHQIFGTYYQSLLTDHQNNPIIQLMQSVANNEKNKPKIPTAQNRLLRAEAMEKLLLEVRKQELSDPQFPVLDHGAKLKLSNRATELRTEANSPVQKKSISRHLVTTTLNELSRLIISNRDPTTSTISSAGNNIDVTSIPDLFRSPGDTDQKENIIEYMREAGMVILPPNITPYTAAVVMKVLVSEANPFVFKAEHSLNSFITFLDKFKNNDDIDESIFKALNSYLDPSAKVLLDTLVDTLALFLIKNTVAYMGKSFPQTCLCSKIGSVYSNLLIMNVEMTDDQKLTIARKINDLGNHLVYRSVKKLLTKDQLDNFHKVDNFGLNKAAVALDAEKFKRELDKKPKSYTELLTWLKEFAALSDLVEQRVEGANDLFQTNANNVNELIGSLRTIDEFILPFNPGVGDSQAEEKFKLKIQFIDDLIAKSSECITLLEQANFNGYRNNNNKNLDAEVNKLKGNLAEAKKQKVLAESKLGEFKIEDHNKKDLPPVVVQNKSLRDKLWDSVSGSSRAQTSSSTSSPSAPGFLQKAIGGFFSSASSSSSSSNSDQNKDVNANAGVGVPPVKKSQDPGDRGPSSNKM
jgi:hypothetical protein